MKNKRWKVLAGVIIIGVGFSGYTKNATVKAETVVVVNDGSKLVNNNRTNLLFNKEVYFSGVEGNKKPDGTWTYPQFVGEKAVDGDPTTRWSAAKEDNQWLVVDIGEQKDISEIVLDFHANCPEYKVHVSLDGKNYQMIYETTNGGGGIPERKVIDLAEKVQARYVKYEQNKMWKHASNGQYYGSSLISFEAYEKKQELESIEINQNDFTISMGRSKKLDYTVQPIGFPLQESDLIWESNNKNVVSVDGGVVKAVGTGTAIVSLYLRGTDLKSSIQVTVVSERAEYVEMRQRWKDRLLGNNYDVNDSDVKSYLELIATKSLDLWETLNKDSEREYLWEKISSDTTSADYTTQFEKIKSLTLGYYLPTSPIYKDENVKEEILKAINFMIDAKKYNGTYSTGNWWDWQIGSAQPLVDTLILLHDDLYKEDYDLLVKFVTPITKYASDPNKQWPSYTATGANLTDISISVLGTALLLEDDSRMKLVEDNVPKVLKNVTKGDGLYQDGSLIQHTFFPYNGSYGNELLKGVGRIQSILVGSEWEMKDPNMSNLFNVVDKGYLQLMYMGKMPAMFSGRSISRAPKTNPFTTELESGKETIANLTLIAKFAPAELQAKIYGYIKSWTSQNDGEFNYCSNPRDFESLLAIKNIINNKDIVGNEDLNTLNVYSSMDRVFKKDGEYAVGISMYSNRIANYEFGNTENKRGWHTADGMVYLYNQDLAQFGEGYWPTIDSYRLPGTTIDTKELADGALQSKKSPQDWVGGAVHEKVASVGMFLDKSNEEMNLKAKKSWFLLDGQIICLGAGITGSTSATIETILENRLLSDDAKVVTDSNLSIGSQAKEVQNWINIENKDSKNNVGYLFAKPAKIYMDTRTGTYTDINEYFVNDLIYTKKYLTLVKDHGQEVIDDDYEYVIIPGKSSDEINDLYAHPNYEVLKNLDTVQAISSGDILLANIFDRNQKVSYLEALDAMSIVAKNKEAGIYEITLSNPKQDNRKVSLKFNKGIAQVISSEEGYTVNGDVISLDTENLFGQSRTIVVRAKVDKTKLEKLVTENSDRDEMLYTESSWIIFKQALEDSLNILRNEKVTQEQVDVSYLKLSEGIKQLEEREKNEALQLSVNDLEILKKGKTLKVEVVLLPKNEEANSVDWEVQNSAVATIDSKGIITAKKAGTTRIIARTKDGKMKAFTLRVSN